MGTCLPRYQRRRIEAASQFRRETLHHSGSSRSPGETVMFQVEWLQTVLDALADLWTQADSSQRQAITAASHAIDQRLSKDPHNEGESRSGGFRIMFAPPL